MRPSQIKQALNIRTLRADKAERVLRDARSAEAQAVNALHSAEYQLQHFDASYDARIAAFFERTATGVTPESLHSARSFHGDLANERSGIEDVILQAAQVVEMARQHVEKVRADWAVAARAAENLKDMYAKALRDLAREQERAAEQEADELSVARAFRDAG